MIKCKIIRSANLPVTTANILSTGFRLNSIVGLAF
jgi:hypothetical protein